MVMILALATMLSTATSSDLWNIRERQQRAHAYEVAEQRERMKEFEQDMLAKQIRLNAERQREEDEIIRIMTEIARLAAEKAELEQESAKIAEAAKKQQQDARSNLHCEEPDAKRRKVTDDAAAKQAKAAADADALKKFQQYLHRELAANAEKMAKARAQQARMKQQAEAAKAAREALDESRRAAEAASPEEKARVAEAKASGRWVQLPGKQGWWTPTGGLMKAGQEVTFDLATGLNFVQVQLHN